MSWLDGIRASAVMWGMKGLTQKSVESISARDFENFFKLSWVGADKVWGALTNEQKDQAYRSSSIIYACTRRIVHATSEAIVRIGKKQEDGSFKAIENSPVMKLVRRPNPDMNWDVFMQYHRSHLLSTGRSHIWKWRNRLGVVTEMWPLPTHWVKVKSPDRKLVEGDKRRFIDHYEITVDGFGRTQIVQPEDMIYGRFIDPDNFTEGVGPLEAAYRDYKIDTERENYLAEMLANMHVPGLVIKQKAEFTKPQKDDLRAKLREKIGKGHKGSPLLLSGEDATAEVLEPLKDLDWPGLSNMSEARICAAYGVPPILVGVRVGLENSPWSNVGEARNGFYQTTVIDFWDSDSFIFTEGLIRGEGEKDQTIEIYFDYSNVKALQKDFVQLTTRASTAFDGTLCDLAEARAISGFDAKPGTEDLWKVPMGYSFVRTKDLVQEIEPLGDRSILADAPPEDVSPVKPAEAVDEE